MGTLYSFRGALCLLWLGLVGLGFGAVLKYENTPGEAGQAPGNWPVASRLKLDAQLPTLIIFAHPRCPCTRATIEELNRLLVQTHDKVSTQVWFFQPEGLAEDWSRSDLWHNAAAIPGLQVRADIGGQAARQFGAETSGLVLLYNPEGQLLFRGGITGGRGHAGNNAGESTVVALLQGKSAQLQQTPVYGCSLIDCESQETR